MNVDRDPPLHKKRMRSLSLSPSPSRGRRCRPRSSGSGSPSRRRRLRRGVDLERPKKKRRRRPSPSPSPSPSRRSHKKDVDRDFLKKKRRRHGRSPSYHRRSRSPSRRRSRSPSRRRSHKRDIVDRDSPKKNRRRGPVDREKRRRSRSSSRKTDVDRHRSGDRRRSRRPHKEKERRRSHSRKSKDNVGGVDRIGQLPGQLPEEIDPIGGQLPDDIDRIDRISELPDEILNIILEAIPVQTAAATTVLSKRWRNLFSTISNLNINRYSFTNREPSPYSLVKEWEEAVKGAVAPPGWMDALLSVINSRRAPVKYCTIRFIYAEEDRERYDHIMDILSQDTVVLNLYNENFIAFPTVPFAVFTSQTLKELDLYGALLVLPPDLPPLLSLTKLNLSAIIISDDHLERLVSCCPALCSLGLHNCDKFVNLAVNAGNLCDMKVVTYRSLHIFIKDAPQLKSVSFAFDYTHERGSKFYEFHGKKDGESEVRWLTQLLESLTHIENLSLSFHCSFPEVLVEEKLMFPKSLACSLRLKKLCLTTHLDDVDESMILSALLNSCPYLHELVIECKVCDCRPTIKNYWKKTMPSECVKNHLTVIRFYFGRKYYEEAIDIAKLVLMNACALKKVEFRYCSSIAFRMFLARDKLSSLVWASPNAILDFAPGLKSLDLYRTVY